MIPADVDLVLALGLAKDRDQRFASAPDFAAAFEQASHNALDAALRERARALLGASPWAVPK
jgi:hypothetical protein